MPCAYKSFFLFGSSIPLGLYTATVVSRLNYLEIRAAGVTIALYGGLGASYFLAFAGLMQWVLSHPELATSTEVIRALQDVAFITGGPAHTTLLGLLLAGVAIPSLFMGLLPRWLSIFGLVLAVFGELSSLSLKLPQAMIFIPLATLSSINLPIRSEKAIRDYNIVSPDQRTKAGNGLAAARPLPKTMPRKRRKGVLSASLIWNQNIRLSPLRD
jgi:hypothetical protein